MIPKAFRDQAIRYGFAGCPLGLIETNVQLSQWIRPVTQTEAFGMIYEPGQLRAKDLQTWQDSPLPADVLAKLRELTQTEPRMISRIRHFEDGKEIVHGYFITTVGDNPRILFRQYGSGENDRDICRWFERVLRDEIE